MSNIKYTEKADSFFNGPKKYAKYTGGYIDIYNVLQKHIGEKPCLTPGKHYKIISAGDAYNPLNAFRNYFPMILIKDDRGLVFGFDEDLFDMSDEYASDYEIYSRTHKSAEIFSQSPDFGQDPENKQKEDDDDEDELEYSEEEEEIELSHDLFYENLEKLKADFEFCVPCTVKNLDEVEKMLKTYMGSKMAVLYKDIQTYYVYRMDKHCLYSGNQLILRDHTHQRYLKGSTEAYFLYSAPKKTVKIVESKPTEPDSNPGRFKNFTELKYFIESQAQNSLCPFVYDFDKMDSGSYKELLNKINEDSGIFIGYQTLGLLLSKKDKKITGYNCRNLKVDENAELIEFSIESWQDHPEFIVRVVSYLELNLKGLKPIKK